MGFDIYGCDAKSKKGEYFRNNVWWWRPLWQFLHRENLITTEQLKRGTYNDGYEISKDQSQRIGIKLKHLLSQGLIKKYADEYTENLKALPLEECEICHGTGKRDDEIVKGKCNGCNGKGEKEPWAASYPFSEENVRDFAAFCTESGGFSIH